MASNQPVTVETLKRFVEAFNRHDLDVITEFFAEDCSMDLPRGHDPWGRRLKGKQRFEKVARVASKVSPTLTTAMTGTGYPATWRSLSGR